MRIASAALRVRTRPLTAACAALLLCSACGTPTTASPPSSSSLSATPAQPGAKLCLDTALHHPAPARALAFAAAAVQAQIGWGGQALDAHGRLTQSGASEAEDVPRDTQGLAPWQRVLQYWRAIDPQSPPQQQRLPSVVRGGGRPADRLQLHAQIAQAFASALPVALAPGQDPEFGDSLPSPQAQRALDTAVDRVAVVDSPWSAAFISWLARQAGLADDEFAYSEAHAGYAAAAWDTTQREQAGLPARHTLRACDIAATPPRVGDLVCQTRNAAADLDSFAALGAALAARGADGAEALPMHCDVVTRVDATGFDAVGGNVLQSVTLRRMDFARGTQRLDPSYLVTGCTPGAPGCVDRRMSRQPWSLLLQWRE